LAQLDADLRGEFEAAINALLRDGRIKAILNQGAVYFSAKE
jgi:ABC-type amino acid transport substrate-binding protein